MTEPVAGSYRDRHSGVTFEQNRVTRRFSDLGAEWFRATEATGLLNALIAEDKLVGYETRGADPLVLSSPRLPIVSYPYEWSASMLRDAGLLTLEIAARAWDEGLHLRDASAFNIVFHAGKPVFVDLGSFRPGHTPFFIAYGQFCDHFLNPLVLSATTGVSHRQGWASLDGLSAPTLKRLAGRKLLRPRYLRHVWARASLEDRSTSMASADRTALRQDFGLSPSVIRRNFDRLADIVGRIDSESPGVWDHYEATNTYAGSEATAKREFIAGVAEAHGGRMAVDVGANAGAFAGILASSFETVAAVEPDEAAVEVMYGRIQTGELASNVVPIVADIVDPTPGRGLMNAERVGLLDRLAGADLMVWLAVFHHLVVSRNVPLPMLFDLLARLSDHHVVEHVDPEDEMAKLLLSSREETPWPFDRETFESDARTNFEIQKSIPVSPTRTLYELRRR